MTGVVWEDADTGSIGERRRWGGPREDTAAEGVGGRHYARLRGAVSDLTLDKMILAEAARGNF